MNFMEAVTEAVANGAYARPGKVGIVRIMRRQAPSCFSGLAVVVFQCLLGDPASRAAPKLLGT